MSGSVSHSNLVGSLSLLNDGSYWTMPPSVQARYHMLDLEWFLVSCIHAYLDYLFQNLLS